MNRYTFVIQVHADGPSTLENLSTQERVPVSDLAAVGLQIERWLAALPISPSPAVSAADGNQLGLAARGKADGRADDHGQAAGER